MVEGIVEVRQLAISEVKLVTPSINRDRRGFFSESYNARAFAAATGIEATFVQDNHSFSVDKGVLRGLHFQAAPAAQDKLVRVVRGSILDVAVDIRRGSPTYGRHVTAVLSADNWTQIWVPKGFAHGFCTLEPNTEVLYKTTDFYSPQHDKGVRWNDPALGIVWPVCADSAILSPRDKTHPLLADLDEYFCYAPR
jgi:dTDP-4-dehydrorhamnose 3,5-epimerase